MFSSGRSAVRSAARRGGAAWYVCDSVGLVRREFDLVRGPLGDLLDVFDLSRAVVGIVWSFLQGR